MTELRDARSRCDDAEKSNDIKTEHSSLKLQLDEKEADERLMHVSYLPPDPVSWVMQLTPICRVVRTSCGATMQDAAKSWWQLDIRDPHVSEIAKIRIIMMYQFHLDRPQIATVVHLKSCVPRQRIRPIYKCGLC